MFLQTNMRLDLNKNLNSGKTRNDSNHITEFFLFQHVVQICSNYYKKAVFFGLMCHNDSNNYSLAIYG